METKNKVLRLNGNIQIDFSNFNQDFLDFYELIFTENTDNNVFSWLTACCQYFKITNENFQDLKSEHDRVFDCTQETGDDELVKKKFDKIKNYMQNSFNLDKYPHTVDFIGFLYWVYKMHKWVGYKDNDNIFGFMEGFNLEDTRIVIIGQDPAPGVCSTGYAFHGSDCKASYSLSELLHNEMDIAEVNFVAGATRESTFNFRGWIEQKVLMINSRLTFINGLTNTTEKNFWDIFTDFIVKHLSNSKVHLVFILMGRTAARKAQLIDQQKHKVLKVLHPSWQCNPEYDQNSEWDWDNILPFVNANFYLYENKLPLVDWHSFNELACPEILQVRLRGWEMYLTEVKQDKNQNVTIQQNLQLVVCRDSDESN